MTYSDLWPLCGTQYFQVRILSTYELEKPKRHDCPYDWRDEQLEEDSDGTMIWKTRTPSGMTKELACETFDESWQGGPIHCARCGAEFSHGDLAAKHAGCGEIICSTCTREDRAPRYYACVYLVNRAFGGHEEGGWWYDCGELVDFKCSAQWDTARYQKEQFESDYSNEGRREIGSVLSEGEYQVEIRRTRPPEFFPAHKPHYE